MTKEQATFIKILKSGKYSKDVTNDWIWLDRISQNLFKKRYWYENYMELFKGTNLLNTGGRHNLSYAEGLPFVEGLSLIGYLSKNPMKLLIEKLKESFKGN